MVILITGGAGFLGSHLTDKLIKEGHEIVCFDNLVTGNILNVSHLSDNRKYRFVKHDVTEYLFLHEKLDWILHFASPASPVDYAVLPIQTLKVGALGTHKTLGLALNKNSKFLLASTSEVYGDPLVNPQNEEYLGNVDPIGPRGVYDEAKRFGEALTMAYHRVHGLDTRIARIFNTYGPKMRALDGRVVPALINQALKNQPMTIFGNGMQTRSFCYISDMTDGLYRLMMSSTNKPVNLGNPHEMTILELARFIVELTGSKSETTFKELPVNDPRVRQPDISRAKKELSWEPTVQLNEGLMKTIEYFERKLSEGE
ncbi:SDR family oxidoreductase [candidate division KSB1 bacterium]|nr:SDR family oxidoreductase [candidate division KSB1 bacterium]